MIPKRAIELAREAGFAHGTLLGMKCVEVEDDNVVFSDGQGTTCTLRLSQIALTPSFWVALGKALGWEGKYRETIVGVGHAADGLSAEVKKVRSKNEVWFDTAHRFYDLILTGGDTEKFWADIISDKK